jgi:uncharacterized protein (DUF2147 family)
MDMKNSLKIAILSAFLLIPTLVLAEQQPSAFGLWLTYDLQHKARDTLRLYTVNGQLVGTISNSNPSAICKACKGALHNKPLDGMTIIWGLKQNGNNWEKGYVLDVNNGKTYRCHLSVSKDNRILNFSPYIGMPWLGPTLHWKRVE